MSTVSFLLGALVGGAAGAGGYYLYTQSQTAGTTASSSASGSTAAASGSTVGAGAPVASRAWPEGYTPAGTAAPLLSRGFPEDYETPPPAEDSVTLTGTAAPYQVQPVREAPARRPPAPPHANPSQPKPRPSQDRQRGFGAAVGAGALTPGQLQTVQRQAIQAGTTHGTTVANSYVRANYNPIPAVGTVFKFQAPQEWAPYPTVVAAYLQAATQAYNNIRNAQIARTTQGSSRRTKPWDSADEAIGTGQLNSQLG